MALGSGARSGKLGARTGTAPATPASCCSGCPRLTFLVPIRTTEFNGTLEHALMADEIDYKIIGDDMQAVIVTLDAGETVVAEAGAMMYMQDGIVMNTTLDATGQGGGLMGKLVAGAKRALTGDSFFVTTF